MDKEVKARLRAVVHLEGISNKTIAEKTGYSELMVSKSLSLKYDVLTSKFLNKFFDSFPEFATKHKEQILNGTETTNLFNSPAELTELRNLVIEQKATINELRLQVDYWRGVFEKALTIHPDLVKLVSPFAFITNNELGAGLPVITGKLVHEGANKGAAGIAAA